MVRTLEYNAPLWGAGLPLLWCCWHRANRAAVERTSSSSVAESFVARVATCESRAVDGREKKRGMGWAAWERRQAERSPHPSPTPLVSPGN